MSGPAIQGYPKPFTHRVLVIPNEDIHTKHEMFRSFFRLIHRARSRSQRMRIYSWLLGACFLFLLLLYVQQQPPRSALASLAERDGFESRGILADRPPEMKFQENSRDNNANNDIESDKNNKLRMNYVNEMGEEEEEDGEEEENADLLPDLAPPVVHFLWCGGADRKFEYRHYLAVRRANEVVKPDKVVLHHRGLPAPDQEGYYTWFNQTLSETANLVLRHLDLDDGDANLPAANNNNNTNPELGAAAAAAPAALRASSSLPCPSESTAARYMLVLRLLEQFGGVFVPEDAILVDFPVHLRAASFVSGVIARSVTQFSDGIIVAKRGGFIAPSSSAGLLVVLASGRSSVQGTGMQPCGSIKHFNDEEDGDCICVKVDHEIFPASIWGSDHSALPISTGLRKRSASGESQADSETHAPDSNFATLARLAGYGTRQIQVRSGSRSMVPRIAHYICWDCDLKFGTYLSVISSLYVAGLSKVYIHGIKEPAGVWWRRLQATQRVVHVHREYPEHSVDRATMTQELALGIMRVAILLKYGGVYCDNRVIWTNPIPERLFKYDAVASPGWRQLGAWPDSVSHSTILAKKNAEYLIKLRSLHAQSRKKRFWFVDQYLSYKLVEQHPDILLLERHLQVACLNHNCHPTWLPGYQVSPHENPPGPVFSWQNDTLSVLWDVFPSLELDAVKYTSGPVVEAARRVLHKAGISLQELTAV